MRKFTIRPRSNLTVRSARPIDSIQQVANLTHETSPDLYKNWLHDTKQRADFHFNYLFISSENIFSWENTILAVDTDIGQIIGLLSIIEHSTNPHRYDYSLLKAANPSLRTVIEDYVEPLVTQASRTDPGTIILTNFCIAPTYRNRGIAHDLINSFLREADKQGYRSILADCFEQSEIALRILNRFDFRPSKRPAASAPFGASVPATITLRRTL